MIEYKDIIKKPPLPFLGAKSRAIRSIYEYFKDIDLSDCIIIDLFGGSGLLANMFKQMYPESTVIFNDFDNYKDRIDRMEETKEQFEYIWHKLNEIHKYDFSVYKKPKLTKEQLKVFNEYVKNLPDTADKITIYSKFNFRGCFSTNPDLKTRYVANKSGTIEIKKFKDYLKGVEVVSEDYKNIMNKPKYNKQTENKKIIYLLDPPYSHTSQHLYKGQFTLKDTMDLIKNIKDNYFVFFSSEASSGSEYFEYNYSRPYKKVEYSARCSAPEMFYTNITN